MADKTLYDVDGKPIGKATPTAETQIPPKSYFDVNGSPLQLNPSGVQQGFGHETYTPQVSKEAEDAAAPYLGRLATNSLPMAGSAFGPGGTLGGTAISAVMRALAPNVFGKPPDGIGEAAIEGGKDLLLNNVIPAGVSKAVGYAANPVRLISSKLLRNFPAVREGMVKELSQQAQGFRPDEVPLTQAIDSAKANLTNYSPSNPIQKGFRDSIKGIEDGSGEYKEFSDKVLKDVQTVRQFKLLTGQPKVSEQLALNKLLDIGEGGGKLNAKKILGEISGGNKEIYSEAISPETMKPFRDLIDEIASQEKHPGIDRVINYASGKLAWAIPSALFGHPIGSAAGAVGTLALTNKMLSKAMSNPETARLVVEAMRTPIGTPKANLLQHALSGLIKVGADVATVPDR